jgi:hypothetical protein
MILFEKFGQHQPLNRQAERYAREGVELSLSTLADQVGACTLALAPLHALIEAHVLAAERLHGDDTRVPVLAKGRPTRAGCGCTSATTVRSAIARRRPRSSSFPATAAASIRSDTWNGGPASSRPTLTSASVPYTSADRPPRPITEALCWAHGRRKFFELADIAANARRGKDAKPISPLALEAVRRIDEIFDLERTINGAERATRLAVRRAEVAPRVADRPGCAASANASPVTRASPRPWATCSSAGTASPASSTTAGSA